MTCSEKRDKATEIFTLEVPEDKKPSDYTIGTIVNSITPKIFYFVIMDCDQNTHMTYQMMPRIEVEFNIVNQFESSDNVDHFTYEEEGTLTLHFILLFLFTPLFFLAIYKCS
jgi:predicted AlkP superfamily phosphohydrolase/phosphomutase